MLHEFGHTARKRASNGVSIVHTLSEVVKSAFNIFARLGPPMILLAFNLSSESVFPFWAVGLLASILEFVFVDNGRTIVDARFFLFLFSLACFLFCSFPLSTLGGLLLLLLTFLLHLHLHLLLLHI